MRRIRITTGAASLMRGLGQIVVERYVDPKHRESVGLAVEGVAGALEDGVGVELQIGKPRRKRLRAKERP